VLPVWCTSRAGSAVFPPDQIAAWQELVCTPPECLGITCTRWTLAALQQVEPVWARYSPSGLWRLLRAARISYQRGRHYVHSPDPEYIRQRDAAWECVTAARNHPDEVVTYYLDELSFYRQPTVAQAWHPIGQGQPLARRAHRSNIYHRVIGAMNAVTAQVVFRLADRTDVPFICSFLRELRSNHECKVQINVILDNWYRVHNHPQVQETASREQISLVYLPTYAPWLNRIEKLWRKAFQEVLHLHRYSDQWPELKERMRGFLCKFSNGSTDLLRYVGLSPD